jgi:hypothetical protein
MTSERARDLARDLFLPELEDAATALILAACNEHGEPQARAVRALALCDPLNDVAPAIVRQTVADCTLEELALAAVLVEVVLADDKCRRLAAARRLQGRAAA